MPENGPSGRHADFSDQWLYRLVRGTTGAADSAELSAWRAARPENERRYLALVRTLDLAARLDGEVDAGLPPSGKELLWRAEAADLVRQGLEESTGQSRRRRWVAIGSAAVILVALGLAWLETPLRRDAYAADEFVTGKGELATVRLRDGTVARLGPESRLRVLHWEPEREVALEGRAFFAVARQPNRPFRVRTVAGDAVVLGTQFQVDVHDRALRVLVVEGRVVMAGKGHEVEVRGGQAGQVVNGRVGPVVAVSDVRQMTSWMRNFLVFQETPLPVAVEAIEAAYGVHLSVVDSTLASRTLTMWFADRSLEEVLTAVCSVIEATCWINDTDVTIGMPRSVQ